MADNRLLSNDEQNQALMGLTLADLIDVRAFQGLMDSFYKLINMPTAILDLEGKILVASGWQTICTQFHRKNPVSATRCLESDTVLASQLDTRHSFNLYKCKNGLMDVATPIIIDDVHLGNLFSGQFLLEKPDIEFFERQAVQLGFDKQPYLKALEHVPVISRDHVKRSMKFLTDLTLIIASAAVDRKKLLILNTNLEQQVRDRTTHLENEKQFTDSLISSLPGIMYVFDQYGQFRSWNRNFELITEYAPEDILAMHPLDFISTEDQPRVQNTIKEVFENGHGSVEAEFSTMSGQTIPYLFTGYKFTQGNLDHLIGVGLDISKRVQTEQEKDRLIKKLQETLSEVKQLSGLLPICASCKKIRDDQGYWNRLESYIHKHSEVRFSHGLCPECSETLYGDKVWYKNMQQKQGKN